MKKAICFSVFACLAAVLRGGPRNGDVWMDSDGVHINAHGGGLLKDGSKWYWYGEHKTPGKAGNKAWVGVGCYSSEDLVTWRNEGVALAVSKEPGHAIEEGCILERPKVVRAQDGSGYVMWFHLEAKGKGYSDSRVGIAKSASPVGPFEFVKAVRPHAGVAPLENGTPMDPQSAPKAIRRPWGGTAATWAGMFAGGQICRDMTLYVDPASGIVYHVYASEDNSTLHIAEVAPNGLDYTGRWTRAAVGDWTEAPALVRHGEWYYLVGSGCTGWRPNPARYYRAKSVMGPWERMGNPACGVNPETGAGPATTWDGQSTFIFEHNGTAFAMFDIWRPSNAIDGRYVWLPIVFDDLSGTIRIDWRDTFEPELPEPWEDQYVSDINRMQARSVMNPYDKSFTMSLDGDWDFVFVNGETRDKAVLKVPGCWQVQGARLGRDWDPPLYINTRYPFAYDPPRVTKEPDDKSWTSMRFRTPRGIYSRKVDVPDAWRGRRLTLRLYGYSSAVYVRIDGKTIGYGEDGRLPNEWDLTDVVKGGSFNLELEVLKHCDGSYLEDQDFWRLSGLFRSVELVSEARGGLRDFNVETRVSNGVGIVSVRAESDKPYSWKVFDSRGDEVGRGTGAQEIAVPRAELWNPERPALYKVWVECAGDRYERMFGFRTVTIEDIPGTDTMQGGAALCVNGRRVVIHGVDRHEIAPSGGYAMTREEMKRDIEVMKAHGINAVRTSHYPDDPYWYDLCDANGILVVAEANIECHGSGHPLKKSALSHDGTWRKAFVERNLNQVAVLRGHPSIICWSLGNESGNGANMKAAYDAVKAVDPTRPVQYEGFFNPYAKLAFDVPGSDIICPMYETPAKVEAALRRGFRRPYILCEFSHAMGNSNGNFDEYMALTEKYASFQGGFIWDFADQAIEGADGTLKYGGDFGDRPNDRHFHCNGLFDAYRRPHPGALEVAYWYRGRKLPNAPATKPCAEPSAVSAEAIEKALAGLRPCFWRAPTDNDRGCKIERTMSAWRTASADDGLLPEGAKVEKNVTREGDKWTVDFTLTVPESAPELPRAGVSFALEGDSFGADTRVAWHGDGPHENYSDRRSSTTVGDWEMTVSALNDSHYVRPQECGHRCGTTRLEVGGVVIEAVSGPFEFNVSGWTPEELAKASHEEELPKVDGKLVVNVDAAMRGVGGDDSWGAQPHDAYRLRGAKTYSLKFSVRAR